MHATRLAAVQKLNNIPHQADLGLVSANAIWVNRRSTPNPAFARAITRTGGTVPAAFHPVRRQSPIPRRNPLRPHYPVHRARHQPIPVTRPIHIQQVRA
ncbi:MAG TPA: hypothetical protein PK677_00270 [Acidiphilium sp.]|nr:hypothetical protein [Acidiphilium sp.]HQU22986.1 hypothetical protein [Acidiphilium sp.]